METLGTARSESALADPPSWPLRFLRVHNPFYLLSALSMLAGCWLLAGSVTGAELARPLCGGYGARLARVWTLGMAEV